MDTDTPVPGPYLPSMEDTAGACQDDIPAQEITSTNTSTGASLVIAPLVPTADMTGELELNPFCKDMRLEADGGGWTKSGTSEPEHPELYGRPFGQKYGLTARPAVLPTQSDIPSDTGRRAVATLAPSLGGTCTTTTDKIPHVPINNPITVAVPMENVSCTPEDNPPTQEDTPVTPFPLTAGPPVESEDNLPPTLYTNTETGSGSMIRDRKHQKSPPTLPCPPTTTKA